MDIQKQFEKMNRNYMDDIKYEGFTYHTIYSDDTCIDDGLPFSYAYRRNDDRYIRCTSSLLTVGKIWTMRATG